MWSSNNGTQSSASAAERGHLNEAELIGGGGAWGMMRTKAKAKREHSGDFCAGTRPDALRDVRPSLGWRN